MANSVTSFLRSIETRSNFIENLRKDFEQGIKKGNLPLVKEIIEKGMPLNWPLNEDLLPLHLAVCEKQPEIVSYLLEKGANPEMPDAQNLTAVDHAALMNDQAMLGRILSYKLGKDLKEVQEQIAAKGGSHIDAMREKTQRLSIVTGQDLPKMAELSKGAYFGLLPQMQNLGPVRILNRKDANGLAPIHYAILGNQFTTFERLIQAEANVKILDNEGNSLLHFAALKGSKKIAARLLELGLDPNLQNKEGNTPLHYAAVLGSLSFMETMSKAGAKINVLNGDGMSPLALMGASSYAKDPLKLNRQQLVMFAAASVDWLCQLAIASGWISNQPLVWAASLSVNAAAIAASAEMSLIPNKDPYIHLGLFMLRITTDYVDIPLRAYSIYHLALSALQGVKLCMKNLYRKPAVARNLFVHAFTAAHSLHIIAQKCTGLFASKTPPLDPNKPVCTEISAEDREELQGLSLIERLLDKRLNSKCLDHARIIWEDIVHSVWRKSGLHPDTNLDPRATEAFVKLTESRDTLLKA